MRRRARAVAARTLREVVTVFESCGFQELDRGELTATLERESRRLRLHLRPRGGIFGGSYGLEITSGGAPLPVTRGVSGRGRGTVRLTGVDFRAKRGDGRGGELAARLTADEALQQAIVRVHFERVRVEPDGRPVVRHLGGSVVWILFPPLVRGVPLVAEQAEATARALAAFEDAADDEGRR